MRILFLFVIILLSSCATSEFLFNHPAENLRWLENADPANDFEVAVNSSDFRFMGLYGEGPVVPIVDDIGLDCIDLWEDVNYIEGTTDAALGNQHHKLLELAYIYAQEFNEKMLNFLIENHDFKCKT